ncbi:MAG: phosphoenolpyruvate carboxykinase (ATP) [Chitinophagaceae bacterium]|nr:phosphoenolpyruvate carboxykinase (ATP) [Chitinophagaceae bacterium]MBN8667155.1 phosphoenolpyruvate carboxykinase (ATP) [Chitinophagales bacterium]
MSVHVIALPTENLAKLGLKRPERIHYQSSPEELADDTLRLGEGRLNDTGALVIDTGEFTGRSPKDKFIIRDTMTDKSVNWNEFNIPLDPKYYDIIYKKTIEYLDAQKEIWVRDCYACADTRFRTSVRVINEKPWTNLFAYNMFLRPEEEELDSFKAEWHVISAPGLKLDPKECGIRQHNVSLVSFKHKTIIIAGSGYTGETKKGVFTILNYILPQQMNVLSMHCSANMGEDGDTAIFFGLSGTGKTTLSADPQRRLIGDDEHGWSDTGIFNFEGGCYAKCINLSEEKEPEIFHAIRPGALVENTVFFPGTNRINFDDDSITENTRVSYPLHFISNTQEPSVGGLPTNIFFLTCDAFGVLPPVSKLNPAQAMYQFISGYTAKIAGTEAGITEPKPTFSACFGAPFIPLHPGRYAEMLGRKMKEHNVNVWLINTGWTGGPYGTGRRMKLSYTRAMITAALNGQLNEEEFEMHPLFGVMMPKRCPGVPVNLLNPRYTWADRDAYDTQAIKLAQLFIDNFAKYADGVSEEVRKAAPKTKI